MILHRKARTGFTLIELLVVIAIIAILIGLLIPAVQKVREAGQRTASMNNLHQLAIACHSYNDSYKALPSAYAYPNSSYNNGTYTYSGTSGNWAFLLLPYIEQSAQYDGTFGPYTYSFTETYTYNGTTYNYSYSYSYPGQIYAASRAPGGPIQTFTAPGDPTIPLIDPTVTTSPISYLANTSALTGSMNLAKITDGTSNTLMLAEGYAQAAYNYTYNSNSPTFIENISEQLGYIRVWNYDSTNQTESFSENYSYTTTNGVTTYTFTESGNFLTYGSFSQYGYDSTKQQYITFQVTPLPGQANYQVPQACTSAGLPVALCDASVRIISPSISLTTWQAACTPTSGDQLGPDW